ncbi:hypothetical protein LTR86_001556 [Recurvomyces mirabilis]|nr:hypothetical protein LTR86_001556 [Recurvomyces mirabilis]
MATPTATPTPTLCPVLELSHELLHSIFVEIDHPSELSSLSLTCRDFNRYIRSNRLLHKEIYCRRYDEPRLDRPGDEEADWEQDLHNLVRLERLLECEGREQKLEELDYAQRHIMRLIETANPDQSSNIELLRNHFVRSENADALLCSSSLFARAGNELQRAAPTVELRQVSAKLHCMFGVPIDQVPSRSSSSQAQSDVSLSPSRCTRLQMRPYPTHTYARSKVYDLREYTDASLWGPFLNDGSQRVDWEKVEAVMIVLGFNLNRFTERSDGRWQRVWDTPFEGAAPNSYRSISSPTAAVSKDLEVPEQDVSMLKIRELAASLDAQDPYGVSGTWMRVVCFLDYNDLYAYNFTTRTASGEPRPPVDTEEGLIDLAETIKLQVTKILPPGSGDEDDEGYNEETGGDGLDWSAFKGERLPVVHFRGSSRSLHASWDRNANSKIRALVFEETDEDV